MNQKRWIGCFVLLAILLNGCQSVPVSQDTQETGHRTNDVIIEDAGTLDDSALDEIQGIYTGYSTQEEVNFFVTVRRGPKGTATDYSLAEIEQTDKFYYGDERSIGKAEAIVQEGTPNGPQPGMYGYNALVSNATINVRGFSSTQVKTEKSFSLKLYDSSDPWRGQRHIALIKSPYDDTRVRNRVVYSLMEDIPDLLSYRTQFVRLFICDQTENVGNKIFKDYGLYTQVEIPNKRYLRNHGLDRNGHLYKARMFEFQLYPDKIKLKSDPTYSLSEFEQVLEIKGNEDHSKLIEMLEAVNNYALDINYVIDTYFSRDNYLTWMAFNLLIGNYDTESQNFLLYSPTNSKRWYFVNWDCDGALYSFENNLIHANDEEYMQGKYAQGLTNYWGSVLHQRFLKEASNRDALDKKMQELKSTYLTQEHIQALLNEYRPTADAYVEVMPDLASLKNSLSDRALICEALVDEIFLNYEIYLKTLDYLMPFFLYEVEPVDDSLLSLAWEPSYSLDGEAISYDVVISQNSDKSNPVVALSGLHIPYAEFNKLDPGLYYYWVTAISPSGKNMHAFDYLKADDRIIWGVRRFLVTDTGEIVPDFDFNT